MRVAIRIGHALADQVGVRDAVVPAGPTQRTGPAAIPRASESVASARCLPLWLSLLSWGRNCWPQGQSLKASPALREKRPDSLIISPPRSLVRIQSPRLTAVAPTCVGLLGDAGPGL